MPRVGVAQFQGGTQWEENIIAVRRLARKAAEAKVNYLCLPELCNTIYPAFANDPGLFRFAEREDGPSVRAAREIAREAGIVLVYPFFEKDEDRYYNSAIVFDPSGAVLTKYRKNTIPKGPGRLVGNGNEDYYFQPGDVGFPVAETELGVRIGLIICYDRNLPEPARCSALNGADLLCVPVTTTQRARSRWELLLRARAVENVFYVAAANRIGEDRGGAAGEYYFGESMIVGPNGEVLAQASATGEDVVWADIDLEFLRRQRESWLFFSDRRPDQYSSLVRRSLPTNFR